MAKESIKSVIVQKSPGTSFSRVFWTTIFLILSITFLLAVISGSRDFSSTGVTATEVIPRNYEIQSDALRQLLSSSLTQAALATTGNDFIGIGVESLYAPVYAAVGTYADFHYSVWGGYSELWAGAFGDPAEKVEELLFTGFNQRMSGLTGEIDSRFNSELTRIFDQQVDENLPEGVSRSNLTDATEHVINSTLDRMQVSAPVSAMASGVVVTKVAAKKVTSNLLAALSVKAAAKLAAKSGTSFLGGAATGAAAGAALGPVGATVGGVLGGVAVWIGVDKLFVEADEAMNRQEFEAELTAIITASKEETKAELLGAVGKKAEALGTFTLRDLSSQ